MSELEKLIEATENFNRYANKQRRWDMTTYSRLSKCVESGISGGWNKAHKHTDKPSEEDLKEQIHNYVMLNINEEFQFKE